MKNKKTLHIYVRCSTDKQIEHSIKRQTEKGIEFSKTLGMDYKIWNDEGESGLKKGFTNREKFTELMMEVEMGYVKHIWCEDYTRLTRVLDDSIKIDTLVMKGDVSIYEGLMGNKKYQPNNTMERMYQIMKTMMGTDLKKDEIRKSKKQKVKMFNEGCYMKGDPPFGYRLRNKKLVKNPNESKWVKREFEWFMNGWSLDKIRTELRVNGVKRRRSNDCNWSLSNIKKHLTNENYIGRDIYTDKTRDLHKENPELYPFPQPNLWIEHFNKCPRIIEDDLFNDVQKLLRKNKVKQTHKFYMLKGVIKCEDCGEEWTGRYRWKDGSKYYRCVNIERSYKRNNPQRLHLIKPCSNPKQIDYDKMNDMVWNTLVETLENSHYIKERTKNDLLGEKYGISSIRKKSNKRLSEIKKELKSLKESQYQLVSEKVFSSDLDDEQFNKLRKTIKQRINELESENKKIENKQKLMDKRGEWIDWISGHNKNIDDIKQITDFREKRKMVDIFINDVIVGFEKPTGQHLITINFKYPLFGDKLDYGNKKNWDRWGSGYRIEKGDRVINLSSNNFFLGKQNFQTTPHNG